MVVSRVEEEDEGEYTCSPAGTTNHSVTVIVVDRSNTATSASLSRSSVMLCMLSLAVRHNTEI